VGLALARGGAFELALEHLAELDADEITPLICKRCVVQIHGPEEAERKRERWRRILQSACKQSGRRSLPILQPPLDWTDWVLQETARPPKSTAALQVPDGVWIATPESAGLTLFEEIEEWILREWGADGPTLTKSESSRISVAIGPEGGFTPEETRLALDRGVRPAQLGDHVLRVATAAAAAMTAIRLAIHHASS
jgi:16S rRNA (uracil1498-N3)-methyltransferase